MNYQVENPDYERSPYTGMGKEHWIQAGIFLLEGIFRHIHSMDSPIVMPRQEKTVSYPREDGPAWRIAAEQFEGLARSFLIAAPLLHNHPDCTVAGFSLRDYYKDLILHSVTPGHPHYLLSLSQIRESAEEGERAFQHTCECASLAIGLVMCEEVIWKTYTLPEQDRIATYLSEFGHAYTGHHNWRLFNMLILGFLFKEGYPIDQSMMRDHAAAILTYYAGDGWYRDGHLFDYYCAWAFHVYGPLWNQWYGYEQEPYIAKRIEQYANRFVETYPRMFGAEGEVIMWGRSSIYRSAAAAPLAAECLLRHSVVNPGLARRIASASLLQFITKDACFYEGIPCLGFYGPFAPMVQSYSCAASPFWMANTFVCLYLPDTHPFWNDKEQAGDWQIGKRTVQETVLDGPGIAISNYQQTGITELRTGKVGLPVGAPSLNAYSRLGFHSQFPWEDFDYQGAEAMQYSLTYGQENRSHIPNLLLWSGERDGVLYRKEYFDFVSSFQNQASIDLADFAIPLGMVRADRIRIPDKPYRLTLGAYGMPESSGVSDVTVEYRSKRISGMDAKAVILTSSLGQTAFVNYCGLQEVMIKRREGVSAISKQSILPMGIVDANKQYDYGGYLIVSVILTGKEHYDYTEEELFPVTEVITEDQDAAGGIGTIIIRLRDGSSKVIDYEGIEGSLHL